MEIEYILLEDFEFNVEKKNRNKKTDNLESRYNSIIGYGISHSDEITSDTTIFLKLDLEFLQDDNLLYKASSIFQITLINSSIEKIESYKFHISALREVYEKFSTLHNISVSQTPWRKAIIADEELEDLITQIKSESIEGQSINYKD